jgi:hypothetical protein
MSQIERRQARLSMIRQNVGQRGAPEDESKELSSRATLTLGGSMGTNHNDPVSFLYLLPREAVPPNPYMKVGRGMSTLPEFEW